jgi:hypothetical protein
MGKLFRFIFILLSVATGALFIYSAYTKLFPTIQAFEYNIAGQLHVHYMTAAIAARFFIALEAGLGSLILFHFFGGKKWVLKVAFALISVFSIYLIWLWIKMGNNVNCGCFGDSIFMRPSVSLLKNAATLLAIWLLIRYHQGFTYQWARIVPPIHLLCVFTLAYLVFPVFTHYKLNFKAMYADPQSAPTVDLAKGKHIIAFLSRACMHCRKAALKMHQMKVNNPSLPFFFIIGGTTSDLTDFWNYTHAQDIPNIRMEEKTFLDYTGGEFPQIIWINNGVVEANTTYPELDQKVIEEWVKTLNP